MKKLITLLTLLIGCGTEVKQTQAVEGEASLEVKIVISFPECAGIEDDELRVDCVKAAANLVISIGGELTDEQKEILDTIDEL